MLLKRKIQLAVGGLLLLGGASAGFMILEGREMHALNLRLLDDAPSVDEAEQVVLQLEEVARLDGNDGRGPARDASLAAPRRIKDALASLDDVEQHSATPAERALIATVRRDLVALENARGDADLQADALSDAARLVNLNRKELEETTRRSDELAHQTELAAMLLVSFAVGAGILSLLVLTSAVYSPLQRITDSMARIEAGDANARVAIASDDELGRLSRALDRMLDSAARREEEKAAFVAGIAHDVRTPLATISLGVEALRRSLDDPKALSRTEMIERQVARLDRLLTELLETARIAAGNTPRRMDAIALDELASEAFELFRDSSPGHQFTLETSACVVRADPDLLMRVLVNLLSNAVKYSPNGGRIEMRVIADKSDVFVSVKDDGIGIAPEARERVFERFARVDPRSDVPGTGLGLYLARRIVLQHGGELDFESAPGRGSRFWIRLPRAEEAVAHPVH